MMAWNGLKMNKSIFNAEEKEAQPNESQENSTNEQTLAIQYFCTRLQDKINILFKLEPQEPQKNIYGKREVIPVVPMRIVCVIDVSHSMSEPYGPDKKLSKLERIKLFAKLLINTIGHEDHLSIVTFGTTAQVIVPLMKMSIDAKKEALRSVDSIDLRGVTNMSSGIFAAIDQFNVTFSKSRNFNDSILIFTDGMSNEGITNSEEIIREIRKKMKTIKEECHYGSDYAIRFSTLGTGGFLPEMLFQIGQTFSSDAFFFLDEESTLELDLMLPILLKQNSAVDGVKIIVSTFNGVHLDHDNMSKEYTMNDGRTKTETETDRETYFIYDIAFGSSRHLSCSVKLPHKHKKLLKGKEILKIEVSYRDVFMCSRTIEKIIYYSEIPTKESKNDEMNVLVTAKQECRMIACKALDRASVVVAKLDRTMAKTILQTAVQDLRSYFERISNDFCTLEEGHVELSDWVDSLVANLDKCDRFIGNFAVRWDDAWAQMKALQSSMAREVPSTTGTYADGVEIFSAPKVKDRLSDLSELLKVMYIALGLSTDTLDKYQKVVEELETRLED